MCFPWIQQQITRSIIKGGTSSLSITGAMSRRFTYKAKLPGHHEKFLVQSYLNFKNIDQI